MRFAIVISKRHATTLILKTCSVFVKECLVELIKYEDKIEYPSVHMQTFPKFDIAKYDFLHFLTTKFSNEN